MCAYPCDTSDKTSTEAEDNGLGTGKEDSLCAPECPHCMDKGCLCE